MYPKMLVAKNRIHSESRFYKYCNLHTAEIVLSTRALRWSSPLLFNDPFDYARKLSLGFSSQQFSEALVAEVRRMLDEHIEPQGFMESPITALLAKMKAQPEGVDAVLEQLRISLASRRLEELPSFAQMQSAWDVYIPFMRILCLAAINDSEPMWAHYSDNYRGVVLEFGRFDEFDSPMLLAKKVIYNDAPPVLGSLNLFIKQFCGQAAFDYDQLFGNLEIIKKSKWEYEQEWRVVSNDRKNGLLYTDIEFHSSTLRRIYLGHNVDQIHKDTLLKLCDHGLEHIEVFDSRIDQDKREQLFWRIK